MSSRHRFHQDLQSLKDLVTTEAASNTQYRANIDSWLRSNHHHIDQDLQFVKDLITTEAASNVRYRTIIDSQLRSNQHNIDQDLQSIKGLIISQFQHLNGRLLSQAEPSSTPAQMFPYVPAVPPPTTVGGTARTFQRFIDQPSVADSNQSAMVALARSHSSLSPHQINDTLENLEAIIRFVMASVLICTRRISHHVTTSSYYRKDDACLATSNLLNGSRLHQI
jgi:hypothetical protein